MQICHNIFDASVCGFSAVSQQATATRLTEAELLLGVQASAESPNDVVSEANEAIAKAAPVEWGPGWAETIPAL